MKTLLCGEQCKKIQLDILSYVDRVCREHRLTYFLGYGSLLGAVRHQGFIPWDDDIDLLMPRADYRKLLDLLAEHPVYRSLSIYHNEDYYYPYAKITDVRTVLEEENSLLPIENYGINLDIFPLDGLPDDEKKIDRHYDRLLKLRMKWFLSLCPQCPSSRNWVIYQGKKLVWHHARRRTWRHWVQEIDRLAAQYPYAASQVVGDLCAGYGRYEVFRKEVFASQVLLPFEDRQFAAPVGYETFLTTAYGDYRKLPPKEQQTLAHPSRAWMKE